MIGLLPAAGRATRIGGLPKWLLPVPEGSLLNLHVQRLQAAGATKVYIGAGYHNSGLLYQYAPAGTETYLVNSKSMPETVKAAGAHLDTNEPVILAMPDTYWTDATILSRLAAALLDDTSTIAGAALWEVNAVQARKLGVCAVGSDRITAVIDKSETTDLRRAWGVLAWRKAFWQYIAPGDAHMGVALQRAIDAGKTVCAVYAAGPYYDCGTTDDYFQCIRELTEPEVAR